MYKGTPVRSSFIHGISLMLLALFFCSCQSYRTIEIATYNPAIITFPPEIKTVMIVNNAAQQPDTSIYQNESEPTPESLLSLSADSMAYIFCLSLGKAIAESPVFDDVRLCEDTIRTDSAFLISRPFTQDDVKKLCNDYNVDALISLDKFYFKTFSLKWPNNLYSNWSFLTVIVTGELKALYPGYSTAQTIPFTDSLQWTREESIYYREIVAFAEEIQIVMRYFSDYIGEKMNKHFVPYWDDDKRWYYTHISSEWKRASAYVIAEKWEEAVGEWRPLFDKVKKWKKKAELASNLALYYEIKGDFHKAIEYAEIANSLFITNTDEDDYIRLRQQTYLETLIKRAEDDEILSIQLRERIGK